MRHLLLALFLPVLSACSTSETLERPLILGSPLGNTLDLLWKRHGDIRQWSSFHAVEMRYEGEGLGARVVFPRLLIPLDELGCVYAEEWGPAGDDASPYWRKFDLRGIDGGLRDEEDFALRSIRRLFHLPFFLGGADWGMRAHLTAGDDQQSSTREFEAQPCRERYFGPFLVPGEEMASIAASPDRRLSRTFYLSRHPFGRKGPHEVVFSEFETIQGIVVATRREHISRAPGDPLPPSHPFERPTRSSETLVWSERISSLRFLDATEFITALVGRDDEQSP